MIVQIGGGLVVTLVILSVLSVVIVAWWMLARHRDRFARDRAVPLPLFTTGNTASPAIARPARLEAPPATSTTTYESTTWPPTAEPERSPYLRPASPVVRTREATTPVLGAPLDQSRGLDAVARARDAVSAEAVDGASVRYWRPADGTLQFLPGRLEVVAGRDAGQEIRFVRTPGPDGARVTFGRAEGAPYRHVQLREPTVSRAHARMALEPGTPGGGGPSGGGPGGGAGGAGGPGAPAGGWGWRLENLSATNPVVVNGRALAGDGGPGGSVVLRDGDRIEMGEVAFVFHSR